MLGRCTHATAAAAKIARVAVQSSVLGRTLKNRVACMRSLHSWRAAFVQTPATSAWTTSHSAALTRNLSSAAGMVDVDSERDPITVTERCAKRILKVASENGGFLRLQVDGGGCSGFQYKFIVDSEHDEDDTVIERDGAKVVVDESSLEFVKGSTLDFVEEMISSSFQVINNPQSESSCGCGTSFSPKM